MHNSVRTWVSSIVNEFKLESGDTLEVGAYNENGSVRDLFTGPYIGIDFREGNGVDRVMDGHQLDFEDSTFDTVVSTETLEHDNQFWLSLSEMGRVLKPGGFLLVTSRGNGFPEHSYPDDYYRFMPSGGKFLANLAGCTLIRYQDDPEVSGIFVLASKV